MECKHMVLISLLTTLSEGCVLVGEFVYKNIRMNTPGNCLSSCGTGYLLIGLSINKCYCLNQEITQPSTNCGVQCTAMKGVACGSNTSISIYKVAYGRVNSNSDGDCLQMEKYFGVIAFKWSPCDQYLRTLCTLANTSVIGNEVNLPWYQVSQNCFKSNAAPTTLENAMKVVSNQGPAWTGVLRSTAIYSYIPYELPNTDQKKDNFGYCDRQNVKFASITERKRILCYRGGETPLPESTDDPKLQERKQNTGVGVPVGVSVAVIVVIAAAVTVLCVLKRRTVQTQNNDVEIEKTKQNEDGTNDYTEMPEAKDNIPLRYLKTEARDNYALTYHALEKDKKTDNENDTKSNKDPQTDSHFNYPDITDFIQDKTNGHLADLGLGEYAHTYFVLEEHQKDVDSVDGTYNVTSAHKPKIDQETDNVYNKLDENYHATYDHLRKHEAKNQGSNEIYDRKENAIRVPKPDGEPDNVYNHVSAVEESGTYDHVNVSSDAKGAVYGCGV